MYVELKTGYDTDRGPAWISRVSFSKSGRTVYFHGRTLRHVRSFDANHYDVETEELFWVSGPHRDGRDRRYSNVPVEVDPDVAEAYERFRRGGPLDVDVDVDGRPDPAPAGAQVVRPPAGASGPTLRSPSGEELSPRGWTGKHAALRRAFADGAALVVRDTVADTWVDDPQRWWADHGDQVLTDDHDPAEPWPGTAYYVPSFWRSEQGRVVLLQENC